MKISKNSKKVLEKLYSNVRSNSKAIFLSLTTVLAGIGGAYLIKSTNILDEIESTKTEELSSAFTNEAIHELYEKYSNKSSIYIESERVENLALYARFKHALLYVNLANKTKTSHYNDKVTNELVKLNDLNDDLAQTLRQLITDNHDLILNLATNPKIDGRILPNCPPSVQQNLAKFIKKTNKTTKQTKTLVDDEDFSFVFDFYTNKMSKLNLNKKSTPETLKFYSKKFYATLNALIMHDYKLKSRYTMLNDLTFLDDNHLGDHEQVLLEETSVDDKMSMTKREFLTKLEYSILQILDSYMLIDQKDFINFGGVDLLLILYEKHKFNMEFLIPIFDLLSKLSLNSENRGLFIQSGWIKRIHELVVKLNTDLNSVNLMSNLLFNKINAEEYYKLLEKNLILKLIVYKIMFNLKSSNKILYSNMIYPLYPLKSTENNLNMESVADKIQAAIHPDKFVRGSEFDNSVDVIFIHGLLGKTAFLSKLFFILLILGKFYKVTFLKHGDKMIIIFKNYTNCLIKINQKYNFLMKNLKINQMN